MELLPAAERTRRALAVGALLAGAGAQALWPAAWLEELVGRVVAPVSALLVPAAALVEGPVEAAPAPRPAPVAGLAAVEEGLGLPPRVPGTVWWPVPVVERRATSWTLGVGRAFGLFEGQPVVFGRTWLGRLDRVDEEQAVLRLWTAPEEPTGAWIGGEQDGFPAICLGRREGGEPLVRQIHPDASPADGLEVRWRRREGDPPWFEQGGFRLGVLRRRGDEERREAYWAVEARVPAAAEGRVFVGLGAVPSDPPEEPRPDRAKARVRLLSDAVHGRRLGLVEAERRVLPTAVAVLGHGRAVGPVVARRGSLCWTAPVQAGAWPGPRIALVEGQEIDLASDPAALAAPGAALFSRGGGGFPRGLWLGRVGEAGGIPSDELEVVAR